MNIDDIKEKSGKILDQLHGHAPNWVDYLRSDISALIAMVRQLEADKAGLVSALEPFMQLRTDQHNFVQVFTMAVIRAESALAKHGGKA